MTALLVRHERPSQWNTMPGWDVVADLTPPELINMRWIAVLRRRIIAALVVVVLLCAAAYVFAFLQSGTAADQAAAATNKTSDLTREAGKYAGITRIKSSVATVDGQVAGVMQDDVNVPRVIAAIRTALPNTMSIQNFTLTLTPVAAGTTPDSAGLDTSGRPQIGTITVGGSGRTLDDLPVFVERLTVIPGVVNVLPRANAVSSGVAQYSVTLSLTDKLYSHQFDATKTVGK